MKTTVNLKDNIWIQGFDTSDECFTPVAQFYPDKLDNVLYEGKTSEIPEELVKKCVEKNNSLGYKNYTKEQQFKEIPIRNLIVDYSLPPIESIQSACNKEYCVIYKT